MFARKARGLLSLFRFGVGFGALEVRGPVGAALVSGTSPSTAGAGAGAAGGAGAACGGAGGLDGPPG